MHTWTLIHRGRAEFAELTWCDLEVEVGAGTIGQAPTLERHRFLGAREASRFARDWIAALTREGFVPLEEGEELPAPLPPTLPYARLGALLEARVPIEPPLTVRADEWDPDEWEEDEPDPRPDLRGGSDEEQPLTSLSVDGAFHELHKEHPFEEEGEPPEEPTDEL